MSLFIGPCRKEYLKREKEIDEYKEFYLHLDQDYKKNDKIGEDTITFLERLQEVFERNFKTCKGAVENASRDMILQQATQQNRFNEQFEPGITVAHKFKYIYLKPNNPKFYQMLIDGLLLNIKYSLLHYKTLLNLNNANILNFKLINGHKKDNFDDIKIYCPKINFDSKAGNMYDYYIEMYKLLHYSYNLSLGQDEGFTNPSFISDLSILKNADNYPKVFKVINGEDIQILFPGSEPFNYNITSVITPPKSTPRNPDFGSPGSNSNVGAGEAGLRQRDYKLLAVLRAKTMLEPQSNIYHIQSSSTLKDRLERLGQTPLIIKLCILHYENIKNLLEKLSKPFKIENGMLKYDFTLPIGGKKRPRKKAPMARA